MNTKYLLVILAFGLMFLVACAGPEATEIRAQQETLISTQDEMNQEQEYDEKQSIDVTESMLEFEGFAPGKSHIGTFSFWNGSLYIKDNLIVGGEGIIDATSVDTGIEKLDDHLQAEDFFAVENYPEIRYRSTSLDTENSVLTGLLTLHGVTQVVSFPVNITDTGVFASFVLDTTPFEMTNTFVNKEVRINLDMQI